MICDCSVCTIPNPPFLILIRLSAFPRVFVAVQGGKNLAPCLLSSTSLSPCIGHRVKYILTCWADGSAVGLVDLLTSPRKLCLFNPLFSLFLWKWEVGGQGPPIPLAYHIISYHIISYHIFHYFFGARLAHRNFFKPFFQKMDFCPILVNFKEKFLIFRTSLDRQGGGRFRPKNILTQGELEG